MRKVASLLPVLMLTSALAFGQARSISGKVRDENGNPIPFASLKVKGKSTGVSADANGNFQISAESGNTLVVTAVSYGIQEIKVGSGNAVEVLLKKADGPMTEVVVTALGVAKQPRQLGYSTASIKPKELTAGKAVNIQNGLTGKVSGLNIATVNNGVFADTRITLRGIRSLTGNNQPMLVVDGVPVDLAFLNRLNPNDVEDINILKGASAASLYGPDGVNGVILVKTKRGTKNGAPIVTISNTTQFEQVLFLPKFQNQFGQGSGIDVNGQGIYDPIENQQYGPQFDGSMVELGRPNDKGDVQTVKYAALNGEKEKFFNTGVTVQNDVSLQAKDFYLSAQDVIIRGTLPGDKNRRSTFRFNSGKEYGRFKSNFNIVYTKQNYDVANNGGYWEVFNTAMNVPLSTYSDWRNNTWASPNHYYNDYYQNPYFVKDRSRRLGNKHDLLANVELNFKITNWLNATYRAGATVGAEDFKSKTEAFTFSPYAHNVSHKYNASNDLLASVSDYERMDSRLTSEAFLTANKEFGRFQVDGLVGQSFRQSTRKDVSISGNNLIIPTLYNVSNRTGEPGASEANWKTRLMGVFAKASVGFDGWAFLEATARQDWDSRLPLNNNSFFYPGASASVVLSDALEFLKNSNTISYLKLRGSWSKSGNVNLGTGALGGAYQLEPIFVVAGGFPYGNLPGFTASTNVNNPAIKPEFVVSKEAGFEVSFLKNRFTLEATAYLQDNSNQALSMQLSRATGSSTAFINAANFQNKGLEFDVRLTPLVNLGDVKVNFKSNLTIQDSKVTSVYENLNEIGIGNGNYIVKDYPAYMFKLTDYRRDDQGRIIVDRNTGLPSQDPNVKLFGRTLPKYIFGINPSVEYKGITLTLTADYRGGHQVYHGIGSDMDFTGISYRSASNGRQRFVVPNSVVDDGTGKLVPNTNVVVRNGGYGFFEATATNRGINSNYLTSAAAWKIRELAINYELPDRIVSKTGFIKGATIGLVGRNLAMWLPKSNQWTDPEFANGTGNAAGVNDSSILPPNRLYGFSVSLRM